MIIKILAGLVGIFLGLIFLGVAAAPFLSGMMSKEQRKIERSFKCSGCSPKCSEGCRSDCPHRLECSR